MDFNDSPEEAAFRAECRAFFEKNAPRKAGHAAAQRTRADDAASLAAALAAAKDFQRRKTEAGLAAITWPKAFGGRGLPPIMQVIFNQEQAGFEVPRGFFEIGLGMCIPTLMKHGTPEHAKRYVPKAVRGDEIWCQLFSEPVGGSDLAGLITRAVRDGDDWVINGQKIWTSGAHYCDFGIIVARTDPNVAKHEGLTMFFLDMKSPGIEVRRIRQVSGTSNFNEVFFTDVRVPDSQRLGAVGEGWKVSLTTLMNERLAVGDAPAPDFDDIFHLAREVTIDGKPAIADRAMRERLADWYVETQGLKLTKFRTMTALSRGQTPGPEASITKLVSATKLQEIASTGMDLLGEGGSLMEEGETPAAALFQQALLYSPGLRIAGGTDEILRNIIAERVLGLPADMRADKDLPFNKIPRGKR